MKRITLGIIIIAILMLVGCNKVATQSQTDTSTRVEEKKGNSETGTLEQPDPSNSPTSSPSNSLTSSSSNFVKTYNDETHKEIQYGKLSINLDEHHIVSDTRNDNTETFKCEIDKGSTRPVIHMTITVQTIKKQNFPNVESTISYLRGMSPNYEKINIFHNVTDASGIISLYSVIGGGLTNYVVCYKDACYLMESDIDNLDSYLFQELGIKPNYEENKQKIKCANSYTAYVNETISYDDNKADYDIIQGKNGKRYSAEIIYDKKEHQYNFKLNNEKGENLLTLSTYTSDFNDVFKIIDVNMDGYADIQFLGQPGTLNNSYDLYVWDDTAQNFVKVKCDEMLSYFEVHDGYLLNWAKNDASSGVKQKLVWDKNTLIKESEENYQTN